MTKQPAFLAWEDERPPLNTPVRRYKDVIVVTSYGKHWWMTDEEADTGAVSMRGDDGYVIPCIYRAATNEEIVELEAREQMHAMVNARKRERSTRITMIAATIRTTGAYPTTSRPIGERYHDTQNIYGGGSWFVIDAEGKGEQRVPAIWFVQNNGHDGDDWSHNNIQTGGAGGVGSWIPYDAALAAEIIDLEEKTE